MLFFVDRMAYIFDKGKQKMTLPYIIKNNKIYLPKIAKDFSGATVAGIAISGINIVGVGE